MEVGEVSTCLIKAMHTVAQRPFCICAYWSCGTTMKRAVVVMARAIFMGCAYANNHVFISIIDGDEEDGDEAAGGAGLGEVLVGESTAAGLTGGWGVR